MAFLCSYKEAQVLEMTLASQAQTKLKHCEPFPVGGTQDGARHLEHMLLATHQPEGPLFLLPGQKRVVWRGHSLT